MYVLYSHTKNPLLFPHLPSRIPTISSLHTEAHSKQQAHLIDSLLITVRAALPMSRMLLRALHLRQLIPDLRPTSRVDARLRALRQANQIRVRHGRNLHGSRLGNQGQRLVVDVIHVVALQMVAHIVRGTSTSVHAGRWDTDVDETRVVGVAGGEIRVADLDALGGDVGVEGRGAEDVAGVVACEDFVEGDLGADHVVVVVEADLVGFGFGEVACVVP